MDTSSFDGDSKLAYLSSSDGGGDDFSSARDESVRTDGDDGDDDSVNKTNYRSKPNDITLKSDESSDDNDSPFRLIARKKNINRIIDSDDSDESDHENDSRQSTNVSSKIDSPQHSRSNNENEGSGQIFADNSLDLNSASASTSTSTQSSRHEASIFVPDTDDEEEEKLFQEIHISPKTRRSITGRRSIVTGRLSMAPKSTDIIEDSVQTDADDDDDDDDFFKSSTDVTANSDCDHGLPDDPVELSSVHADSFGLDLSQLNAELSGNGGVKRNRSISREPNASIIQTPQSKRVSGSRSHLTESSLRASSTKIDYMDLTRDSEGDSQTSGIHIKSSSTTTSDESKNKNSRSSIIELDTDDDDDDYVPDIKDVSDFGKSTITSTPGPSKKLVQPKLKDAMKMKKFVSREFYEKKERELSAVKVELKDHMGLYDDMKDRLEDKGAKLLSLGEALNSKIRKMENELAELKIEEDNFGEIQQKIASADDWRAGLNQIQPKHTGKVGLQTHNTQKALTVNLLEKFHKAMELCPGDHELAKQPPNLKVSLMAHQLRAIKWMRWREKQKPKGGILADDMGLGKTLTVIALVLDAIYGYDSDDDDKENDDQIDSSSDDDLDDDLDRVRKNKSQKNGGTLIVCPASLVNQWNHEIQTRVKRNKLNTLMHHGNNRKTNLNLISKYDIVMTTYGVISSEHKSDGPLFRIRWDRVVLDEAHMIRNHVTAMSKAACELRANIHWGLTGTPIQNKDMDIFAMFKYLHVSPFDDLQTFRRFTDGRSVGGMSRLHNILKPLLLRRTKAELQIKGELQALPEKTINIEYIDLNSDESTVYTHVLTYSQSLVSKYVAQHEAKKLGFMSDAPFVIPDNVLRHLNKLKQMPLQVNVSTTDLLVLLLRLRQICDHPGLIRNMLSEDDDVEEDEIDENNSVDLNMMKALIGLDLNDTKAETKDPVKLRKNLSLSNPVYNFNYRSSKCKRAIEMVQSVLKHTDDKIVIVSQWTTYLNIVGNHLKCEGIKFVELNGKTPIKSRNDIVVSFNRSDKSDRVMLLSLVAGGVGLNLTGANHLFLLDPHWNPQLESQAFDRVYRVGQTKDVQIYKFLCNNTIEIGIRDIQNTKLQLSTDILTGSKINSGSKLTFQDMCKLFEMGGS